MLSLHVELITHDRKLILYDAPLSGPKTLPMELACCQPRCLPYDHVRTLVAPSCYQVLTPKSLNSSLTTRLACAGCEYEKLVYYYF